MSSYEDARENLTTQLEELETLQSVYSNELVIADHGILADINHFIENPQDKLPQRLEYAIQISVEGGIVELQVYLPNYYPREKPEVYARSSLVDRTQQLLLNKELTTFTNNCEKDEPCIYSLVSWLQDNIQGYLEASKINQQKTINEVKPESSETLTLARYWIYSHHIYSKLKRRDIIDLAKDYSLTGFCLAGKPGIICIEGVCKDCEDCWQKIKVMNWHKILVKLIEEETITIDENVTNKYKFPKFQEISFLTTDRHNDMGQLFKYLEQHGSQHVFKELFGFEGKHTV